MAGFKPDLSADDDDLRQLNGVRAHSIEDILEFVNHRDQGLHLSHTQKSGRNSSVYALRKGPFEGKGRERRGNEVQLFCY